MRKVILLSVVFLQAGLTAQWVESGDNITTMDKIGIGTTTASSELEVRSTYLNT